MTLRTMPCYNRRADIQECDYLSTTRLMSGPFATFYFGRAVFVVMGKIGIVPWTACNVFNNGTEMCSKSCCWFGQFSESPILLKEGVHIGGTGSKTHDIFLGLRHLTVVK